MVPLVQYFVQAWVEYQYNKKSVCAIGGQEAVDVNPVMSGSSNISPPLLPPFELS